uniref:Cytochrome b561 domain-containing protein n=1 Tax=Aegilops tauschii subsp. strangulata TaxID=200361 RepID=A0A453L6V6_AEGTS
AAAHGSHLREVPQDVQVGGPRVVLPPRDLPDHRVRRRGRRLGHRHQPRQRVQRRHLRSPPQHRHRRLRPRHPTSNHLTNTSQIQTELVPMLNFVQTGNGIQVFALFLRPRKDHKCRVYWNAYHHAVGYAVIILGIFNVFKGMAILGVEQRWRTAYVAAVWVLGAVAVTLEAVTWSVVIRRREAEQHGKTFDGAA